MFGSEGTQGHGLCLLTLFALMPRGAHQYLMQGLFRAEAFGEAAECQAIIQGQAGGTDHLEAKRYIDRMNNRLPMPSPAVEVATLERCEAVPEWREM
jgi:hypothetical protein